MEGFGTEQGELLLWIQHALARDQQRRDEPGRWEAVWVPTVRSLSPPSDGAVAPLSPPLWPAVGRPDAPAEPVLPWNELVMDPETGAGTTPALRRDLALDPPDSWLVTIAVEPIEEIRSAHGDEVATRVLRAVAEVAPFALRSRDRVYRIGRNELALLLRETDGDGAATAADRLGAAAARALTDRRLPPVRLSIRPLDVAALEPAADLAATG